MGAGGPTRELYRHTSLVPHGASVALTRRDAGAQPGPGYRAVVVTNWPRLTVGIATQDEDFSERLLALLVNWSSERVRLEAAEVPAPRSTDEQPQSCVVARCAKYPAAGSLFGGEGLEVRQPLVWELAAD
jgi:hypothetical protein